MGRPVIGRQAMTPAERQRRRRKRLRTEQRQADLQARQQRNMAAAAVETERQRRQREAAEEWFRAHPPQPPAENAADEIAAQLAEALAERPSLSIDDIRAAIDRRWPREGTASAWERDRNR